MLADQSRTMLLDSCASLGCSAIRRKITDGNQDNIPRPLKTKNAADFALVTRWAHAQPEIETLWKKIPGWNIQCQNTPQSQSSRLRPAGGALSPCAWR